MNDERSSQPDPKPHEASPTLGRAASEDCAETTALAGLAARLEVEVDTRTRELLDANASLLRRNEELDDFARVASHDLRAPIATIRGLVHLLRAGNPRPDQVDTLDRLAAAGTRMERVTAGLLHYARAGADEEPENVDLAACLADVRQDLARVIEATHATVTADALPVVRGSALALRRVLQNLLDNALKYRSEQAPRIHVSARRASDGWSISVCDNGRGIPVEYRDVVFELFRRGGPGWGQDGTREEGYGVGLAICRRLIETRGGTLSVTESDSGGSVFTFTIPD